MKTIKKLIIATALATTLGPVSVYAMDLGQEPEGAAAALAFTKEQVKKANARLWNAMYQVNIEGVNKALAAGADVNQVNEYNGYKGTPLQWAASFGSVETVPVLIAAGADVNQVDADGYTPLRLAAHAGRARIVEMLVFNGARPSDNVPVAMKQVIRQAQEVIKSLCRDEE